MKTNKLTQWIIEKLNERDWKQADLARKAEISTGALSNILNGNRKAGPEILVAIANALGEPPELVLRLAGMLPPLPGPDEEITLKKLYDLGKRLSPEERARLLSIAELFFREEQARYRAENSPPQDSAAAKSTA